MNVVITGTSGGIGRAVALRFLKEGHTVYGLDVEPATIPEYATQKDIVAEKETIGRYIHFQCDVADATSLPEISEVDILINNAGVQNSGRDIEVNLKGVIHCTEKYGLQPEIKAILNQASVSAHNGAEFPEYVASKGGVLAYTKAIAKEVAKYGATCNSVSFGGVLTELNQPVIDNAEAWKEIMDMTPLQKWATPQEAAEWIYFLTVTNKSMTAQDVIIDNGEMMNHRFVWC